MSLQINFLPEYGWSIKNQPVYGPGSVFQGFVKLNITSEQLQRLEKLRLVFHGIESTYNAGYLQPTYSNQLFGSQKILWRRKDCGFTNNIVANADINIPFIIQMPMVQFPPSANIVSKDEGLAYHMDFTLTVSLDQLNGESILKTHESIIYMPFIETNISKRPMEITTYEKQPPSTDTATCDNTNPSISVKTHSLDYLLGESIPLLLTFKNIPRKSIESVTIRLNQIQTWNKLSPSNKGKGTKSERKLRHAAVQKTMALDSGSSTEINNECTHYSFNMSVEIPVECIPTFIYGSVFSLTYSLRISIKRRGKFLSHTLDLKDIPITLGTLGNGIRAPEELKVYSIFKSVFDGCASGRPNSDGSNEINTSSSPESSSALTDIVLPVPKFLDIVEYEDSLPVYNKDKLPAYETII